MSEHAAASRPAEVLTVSLSPASSGRRSQDAAAAASLPQLFRPAQGGRSAEGGQPAAGGGRSGPGCDVDVVDGAAPGWPQLIAQALDRPARGVLLSPPTIAAVADVTDLAARATSIGCPVVVATPFPYDPTVRDGLSRLRAAGGKLSFADSIVTVPGDGGGQPPGSALGAAFLAQLAAIRMITGGVPGLTMNYETDHAYCAAAIGDEMTVLLAGLVSGCAAPVLRVDLVGVRSRHTICLAEPFAAAPATFLSYGTSGMSRLPLSYESGLRSAWRNLHAAVTSAHPVRYGLRELIQDLALSGAG